MPDVEDYIQIFFALIFVLLLGYVFTLVFWQLSAWMAIVFVLIIAVIIFGMLYRLFREG